MMAYLVVGVHNAYKIWCLRWAVKEKPGKKENSSNSFRGEDFYQNKTAIFSNGCFCPRIFSPPVRSGTRSVATEDPLRLSVSKETVPAVSEHVPPKRGCIVYSPWTGRLRKRVGRSARRVSGGTACPKAYSPSPTDRKFFLQNFSIKI